MASGYHDTQDDCIKTVLSFLSDSKNYPMPEKKKADLLLAIAEAAVFQVYEGYCETELISQLLKKADLICPWDAGTHRSTECDGKVEEFEHKQE